eukprot:g15826.t1
MQLVAAVILLLAGGSLVKFMVDVREADLLINEVVAQQGEKFEQLQSVIAAKEQFEMLRYWMADLAVGWLSDSEDEAGTALAAVVEDLDLLAEAYPDSVAFIRPRVATYHAVMLEAVDAYVDDKRVLGNAKSARGRELAIEVSAEFEKLVAQVRAEAQASTNGLVANNSSLMQSALVGLLLAVVVGSVLAFFSSRAISRPISSAVDFANRISQGILDNDIKPTSKDETGLLLHALASMQTALREQLAKERELADRNSSVRKALDTVSAAVMLADQENRVLYANPALLKILRNAEAEIAKASAWERP